MNKPSMTIKEALNICEEALEKHEGGKGAYLYILEIVEEYLESKEAEND